MKGKGMEVNNNCDSLPLSSPVQPALSVPLFSPAVCCALSQPPYGERDGRSSGAKYMRRRVRWRREVKEESEVEEGGKGGE